MTNYKLGFINGNTLKIIAAVTMLIDHIGYILLPKYRFLRIIGRLAMPIFAFMIAEGCKYTKNKKRYLFTIAALAFIYQVVYYLYDGTTKMCILVTFSLSIVMIYALQYFYKMFFAKDASLLKKAFAALVFLASVAGTYVFNRVFRVDYGFYGCLLPVFAAAVNIPDTAPKFFKRFNCIPVSVFALGVGLFLMCYKLGGMSSLQIYSMLSIPLLFLYSGKRGKYKMKYFFYIFYPAHLFVLELIYVIAKYVLVK